MLIWRRKSNNAVFLLLIVCAPCYSLELAPRADNNTVSSSNDTLTSSTDCGFPGNSDIYGLGIRLGYYSQALSVCIANYFVLSEAKALRSVNLLFLVAIFVGLVYLSLQPAETHAIEGFILLNLLSATWIVGLLDQGGYTKKYWKFSPWRTAISDISLLCFLGYSIWFWWHGIDYMMRTPCGTFVFFFAKVDIYGWFRSACKVLVIPAAVVSTRQILSSFFELVLYMTPEVAKNPEYFRLLRQSLLAQCSQDRVTNDKTLAQSANSRMLSTKGTPLDKGLNTRHSTACNCNPGNKRELVSNVQRIKPDLSDIIQAAIQTPLPPSPTDKRKGWTITSPWPCTITHHPTRMNSFEMNLPSLEDLADAEHYLQNILNVKTKEHGRLVTIIPHPTNPVRMVFGSWRSPAIACRRWYSIFTHRPYRIALLIPLFIHVTSLNKYPLWSFPILLEKALTSPLHRRLSRQTLETILALHTTQLPKHRPRVWVAFRGLWSLTMCIGIILSLELAIHWNGITGTGSIWAVGQLIPAILGIGGLVRVMWIWIMRGDVGEEVEDGVGKELRECAEVYERVRQERDGEGAGMLRIHGYV